MDIPDTTINNPMKKSFRKPAVFWMALGTGILVILATIWLTEFCTLFVSFYEALFIGGIFTCVFAWTILHVCRKRRYKRVSGYIPILFLILGAIISCTVPFEKYL